MFSAANPVAILLPMLVVAALTFAGFIRMVAARASVIKGMDVNFYRAHQGGAEPEVAATAVRHYGNLLELPTLFYAAVLTAYVTQSVGPWTLIFAWAFVALRLVQSAVHLTYNHPAHRGIAFVISVIVLFALWVNVALSIIQQLHI